MTKEQLEMLLSAGAASRAELVRHLVPTIQVRVGRALLRCSRSARGRVVQQEVADLTQDVFVVLLENDARKLRMWDPERGMSLKSFVGFLAEREVYSRLRRSKRSPWTEDPTPDELMAEELAPATSPELVVSTREQLAQLNDAIREHLSPLARQMFQLLFVEDLEVREVSERTAMTENTVHAWRSRLRRVLREISEECVSDSPTSSRSSVRSIV
ncbi:MAG: sigma-70 family RNA polymerase sigma factor [Myxococcota bacterium]